MTVWQLIVQHGHKLDEVRISLECRVSGAIGNKILTERPLRNGVPQKARNATLRWLTVGGFQKCGIRGWRPNQDELGRRAAECSGPIIESATLRTIDHCHRDRIEDAGHSAASRQDGLVHIKLGREAGPGPSALPEGAGLIPGVSLLLHSSAV